MIYDAYGKTESSCIYLARPGKRMLGVLNGADPESCSLVLNFNSPSEITFDVYKYIDEELSAYYDYIDILMEIYVDGYGWFFIDESPAVSNDGISEHKTVIAKSYEYTLHQYDLVMFDVNTASATSREMLAPDNVYTYYTTSEVWYNVFRDRVLFYRDTSEHKALLEDMGEMDTYERLQLLLGRYPHVVLQDWRIKICIDDTLRQAFVTKRDESTGAEAEAWQERIEAYDNNDGITSDSIKKLLLVYPDLIRLVNLDIDKTKYIYDSTKGKYIATESQYTPYQLMELEYKRIKGLSLLDLIISDVPGWSVGYVDDKEFSDYSDVEGVPILLPDETGRFEVDSQDVYSFLTHELAGYFNCVFTFDTINNKINAYRIDSVGVDTKIFIGFRNVQNSVDITPSQELFTQFTVENSEGLSIPAVNFGLRDIEDISYFLNAKYMPQELIDKYKIWLEYREEKRPEYIQLSREYNAQDEVASEIKERVPSDMLNLTQLNNYKSQDQLEEIIDNYYALMIGILDGFIYVSKEGVTPPRSRDTYDDYNDYIADMNTYIDQLFALVDVNKEQSATAFVDSLYYNDYYMMKNFTVPNLVITYNNLSLYSYETKEEYYDSYEFDFQTYGYMYGLDELKVFQKAHNDKMEVLKAYSLAWDEIPEEGEGKEYKAKYNEENYKKNHELYMKYKAGYDSVTQEIEVRQAEYDDAIAIRDEIDERRQKLAADVLMENFTIEKITKIYYEEHREFLHDEAEYYLTLEEDKNFFLEDEVERLKLFFRHTDYINDNINYLKNLDSTDDVINKQLEMYKYAVDELYAESHPQYSYATTLDNLLANNEYEDFHPDFKVGNFIRLGLDDKTQVQLRMISIKVNPMAYNEILEIEFSNMIQYTVKRNDFQSILESALTSAKNSIQARYTRNADNDNTVQVTYDLVQKILQSGAFSNASKNIQDASVGAVTGDFNSISADYIKTNELAAEVGNITELHSDSAFVNYLEGNLVVAHSLHADEATISDLATDALSAQSIDADNIKTDGLTAESAIIKYLESNLVVSRALVADSATISGHADIADLATNALNADKANIADLATESMTAQSIDADNITTEHMTADSALFKYLEANLTVAAEIKVEELKAKMAQIDNLTAGSAFVNYLTALSSSAAQSVIDDAYIYNAVAGKISVADLAAGNIVLTDTMTIISQNENGGNVLFDGDALQFTDAEGNVGIEIGYGSQEYPHIIITDENGTSLWTSTGVTSDGIGDDIIYGRMINDSTIGKEKLNFPIVNTDENGNISIINVLDASGESFGVEYDEFKNTTQVFLNSLNETIGTNIITEQEYEYAVTFSNTIVPTLRLLDDQGEVLRNSYGIPIEVAKIWYPEVPYVPEGYYIWTKTTFVYTDGTTKDVYSVRPGVDGVVPIKQTREFALSPSPTELPEDVEWLETPQYADSEHYLWMRNRTDFSDGTSAYSNPIYESSMSGLIARVDYTEHQIINKIWQTDISNTIDMYDSTTVNTIRTRVTQVEQNISGIEVVVGDITNTLDNLGEHMTSAESRITVNADKIAAMVTVDSQTSAITLTENMIEAMTTQFVVKGSDNTTTVISGGKITANSIQTGDISTDAIKSTNYSAPTQSTAPLSVAGTFLDLANGNFHSPVFGYEYDSVAQKTIAKLAGLNVDSGTIYSGTKTSVDDPDEGFYLDSQGQMNIGDEYNYIMTWKDAQTNKWKVRISADDISFGNGLSVTEIVTNISNDLTYDFDYTQNATTVTFTAYLYKNQIDVKTDYDPTCFKWYSKTSDGMVLEGTGYTITIQLSKFQYGGSVVGKFISS